MISFHCSLERFENDLYLKMALFNVCAQKTSIYIFLTITNIFFYSIHYSKSTKAELNKHSRSLLIKPHKTFSQNINVAGKITENFYYSKMPMPDPCMLIPLFP